MTEIEWLSQEAGLTSEELKAFEAVGGFAKLRTSLMKAIGMSEQALKDKVEAENARLAFEKRYNEEFIPEMRKVTTESIRAQGDLASARAKLKAAQEYGIVPEDEVPKPAAGDPPRAPGSPSPDSVSRDDFGRFSDAQSRTIITLNDLNAEHFKLFGSPLGNSQELVDEVRRQRTLGNKDYSLKQAWETKNNVPAKREELAKADQQKLIDTAVAAARKEDREKNGSNPNLRTGVTSRFSTYKASDATGGKEPWKASHSINERNKPWREKAVSKLREHVAA